jgi:hypothetical protein
MIGTIAMILGIIFFAPFILWPLMIENGDISRVLIGKHKNKLT